MHYQISRNGQMYGPYTLEDLQRYVVSGNVLPTDLAKSEEMSEWLPVSEILAGRTTGFSSGAPAPAYSAPVFTPAFTPNPGAPQFNPAAAASQYPDAPNLHWGLVLLFGFLTCSFFMIIWNLVVAAWLKRVQPNATSMMYYIGFVVLTVLQIFFGGFNGFHDAMMMRHSGVHSSFHPVAGLIGLSAWVVKLIARYSQRASLEEHFNGPEPVGLRLNPVMTFFFGGVYFQYHLNRINQIKTAARYGAPGPL
ncbi:DUF4339 domain-containing protein [Granulicella tundricola]|uniref:GYF domain-containing protein n=1 Tax=Granulicella tundricola (strain ATCC BAA-1859 / DSM 23138 / MP5ACTX9) TaxID=1198114 RepID=E8WXY2_GRATM|nr:DUF4339 domain-containing protein [Granulicella tundricola]ADW67521.1 hypothetical protein AciX9_0449 [Granulicella tundricola MP5ACTX9]